MQLFYFFLNRSLVYGDPYFFDYISIAKRTNVLSSIILEIQTIQKARLLESFEYFDVFVSSRVLKIEHFFFLQSIDNQKIVRVTIYQ